MLCARVIALSSDMMAGRALSKSMLSVVPAKAMPLCGSGSVRGGSNSNERSGWKLLRLDEAFSAHVIDEKSEAPRRGYKRGDKAMSFIDCQI